MKLHVAEGAIVAVRLRRGFRMAAEIAAGLGAAHGMEHLRSGGGRGADNVQRTAAPVGGHLASAAGRIGGRAHGLQHHVVGRDAQPKAQRAIAIVGEEPVIARTHGHCRAHLERLVARARYLEKDLLLPFEQDFAVVHAAREIHQPVDLDHALRAEAARAGSRLGQASAGNCHFHSLHSSKSGFL